jgi:hypothetical protein
MVHTILKHIRQTTKIKNHQEWGNFTTHNLILYKSNRLAICEIVLNHDSIEICYDRVPGESHVIPHYLKATCIPLSDPELFAKIQQIVEGIE